MPSEATMTEAKTLEEAVGLHAKFDQLEAGLEEAHRTLDRMVGASDSTQPSEPVSGAETAGAQCASTLSDLNSRLSDLAGRVGRL